MNDSLKKYGVSNDGTYYSVTISDDCKEYLVNNSIPDYSEIVTTDCLKRIVERDETIENLYKKIYDKLVAINPEEAEKYETYLKIYNGDYRTTVLLIEINALEVKSSDVLKLLKK